MELSPLHPQSSDSSDTENAVVETASISSNKSRIMHPLAEWLQANAKDRPQKLEEFCDESGVQRYKHNWQVVSEEDRLCTDGDLDSYIAYLYRCGMSCVRWKPRATNEISSSTYYVSSYSSASLTSRSKFESALSSGTAQEAAATPPSQAQPPSEVEVLFIEDYVKTFNFLSSGRADAFGRHAALFEITLLILFDARTVKLVSWALGYIALVFVLMIMVDPGPTQVFNALAGIIILLCQYVAYRACCSVYKASVKSSLLAAYAPRRLSSATATTAVTAGSTDPIGASTRAMLYDNDGRVPLSLLLRTYFGYLGSETFTLLFGISNDNSSSNQNSSGKCGSSGVSASVDQSLLEESRAAVDFSHANMVSEGATTNQCSYYLLLNVGVKLLEKYRPQPSSATGSGPGTCADTGIDMGRAGGYYIVFFFFYQCVVYLATIFMAIVNDPCLFHIHSDLPRAYNCNAEYIFMILTVFNIIPAVCGVTLSMGIVVAITGLYYGSVVVRGLATAWVQRYSPLRKYRPVAAVDPAIVTSIDSCDQGSDKSHITKTINQNILTDLGDGEREVAASDLESRILTDAHEHYLLLREYVTQLSSLWSGIVLILMVVGTTLTIYAFWCVLQFKDPMLKTTLVLYGLFFIILCQLAISCFAWANSAVQTIQYALRHSAGADDYQVIGGREAWIAYLEDSPAQWTIYGFAITWNVLYAYASSGITAIIGIWTYTLSMKQ